MRVYPKLIAIALSTLSLAFEARPGTAQEPFQLLGSPDAPVEMTVYSDFECPYCRNFALVALPALTAEFVDTGELRIRFIYFPLSSIHPNAVAAARAAHCAGRDDRFWAYHDYVFVRQPEWGGEPAPDSLWIAYADHLGLDTTRFAHCLADEATEDVVRANWAEGLEAGVTGTPTVLLQGEALGGLESYEGLRRRIKQAVASARADPGDEAPDGS